MICISTNVKSDTHHLKLPTNLANTAGKLDQWYTGESLPPARCDNMMCYFVILIGNITIPDARRIGVIRLGRTAHSSGPGAECGE